MGNLSTRKELKDFYLKCPLFKKREKAIIKNCVTVNGAKEFSKRVYQRSFQPYKTKYRKPGTGGVYQLNDHQLEGKFSPRDANGKRTSHNVYAKTREECEEERR